MQDEVEPSGDEFTCIDVSWLAVGQLREAIIAPAVYSVSTRPIRSMLSSGCPANSSDSTIALDELGIHAAFEHHSTSQPRVLDHEVVQVDDLLSNPRRGSSFASLGW